jgi:hypothetical protein
MSIGEGSIHRAGGTTVSLVVVRTLGLIEGLLGSALAVIGLSTASDTISGVGDSLLDLVRGGLGGIRSDLLLGLYKWVSIGIMINIGNLMARTGREILATGVRHVV